MKEMKRERLKKKVMMVLVCGSMLSGFLAPISPCMAGDHKDRIGEHGLGWKSESSGWFAGGKHDEGNETTGQIAGWSLAVVNLTVALSLTIKGIRRFVPLSPENKNALKRFNSLQKKHLMKLHYLFNPLILLIAITHWLLSRCRSTSLPEWGLLIMCVVALLGILIKVKLCPKTLLQSVYRIHTQPAVFIGLISLLVIGHLMVD